jgi:adenylate cyclase
MRWNMGHILIVDDNEMNREVLARRLQHQHHTFGLAADGLEALEALRQSDYDLVLLDVMMPRMDGYQTLQRIKSDPALRHLPIVMISADHELESVMKCIELGADDYLFKPFNAGLLKSRLANILGQDKQSPDEAGDEVMISSEDLKEPITHAMRCVDQLLTQVAGPINETQTELLGLVQSRLAQMMGMIVDP